MKKSTLDRQLPGIRGPFDRVAVPMICRDETMTHQSFKDECDINNIMRKYERGALIEHVNRYQGDYGDFTAAPEDYHQAMAMVLKAQEMFMTLPATVRDRFANDPGSFLAFTEDPENRDEMERLGLLSKKRPVDPAESLSPERATDAARQNEPADPT